MPNNVIDSVAPVVLEAGTASAFMTPNPVRAVATDSLRHAISILVDHGVHSLPVVNETGQPVGVLSASDVMARRPAGTAVLDYYARPGIMSANGEPLREGFQVESVDRSRVCDAMSPVVYSIPFDASLERILGDLLGLHVHQLFVVDRRGALLGVVSAVDLLRRLTTEEGGGRGRSAGICQHLTATTAADLMALNPISVRKDLPVDEARAFLAAKEFRAAPVIDPAGRPVGVVSQSDFLIHERERVVYLPPEGGEAAPDPTLVADLMTPAVFTVPLNAPAIKVIQTMVGLRVHRVFVVDDGGILVGVVSAVDVLRHLCPSTRPRK